MKFKSYSRENKLPNKLKLFQGQEHIDDLGLNWDSFKWRNHQPDIGRFFNVDPIAEKYYYNSPYAFSENKVTAHIELEGLESWYAADGNVVNGPVNKETIKKEGLRAIQSTGSHAGSVGIRTAAVRAEYNAKLKLLTPSQSGERSAAKIEAREKLPALSREISEKMRPMKDEASRTSGTANKSNNAVNEQAKTFGKVGAATTAVAIGVSTYNIATSSDPGKQAVVEGGAWSGAISGGALGAEVGSVLGPLGAAAGGLTGSIIGGFTGATVAEGSMTGPPATEEAMSLDGQILIPKDVTNRIQIEKQY